MNRISRVLAVAMIGLLVASCANKPRWSEWDAAFYAEKQGVDYYSLLSKAETDDKAACEFLKLANVMDAGPAEEYSIDVTKLLSHRGDNKSVELIQSLTTELQGTVLMYVAYDRGPERLEEWKQFEATMPKLARQIRNNDRANQLLKE